MNSGQSPFRHIVVSGVSGVGKSTIGQALASRLGRSFADADDFHTPEAISKMSAGIPLTSSDREPWLRAVRAWMDRQAGEGKSTVVACSALKKSYRELLRGAENDAMFVFLSGPKEKIEQRLVARREHFMPASLLTSQLQTLEPLEDQEAGLIADAFLPVDRIVDLVGEYLSPVH